VCEDRSRIHEAEAPISDTSGHAAAGHVRAGRAPVRVYLWPLLLLLVGAGAAYLAGATEQRAERERRREAVRVELEPIRGALSREVFSAIELTEGIAALVSIEGGISEEKFRAFTAELFRRNDLVRNIALAPDNVVTLVFPLEGSERAIGLEYARNAAQWPSVERMMREHRLVVAGPVALVQGGVGVIGRRPIYVIDPPGSGRSRYWGLTSTVIDLGELLARTPITSAHDRLTIALRGVDGLGDQGAAFWGDDAVFRGSPVIVDVLLPSGTWQLAAVPRGGWTSTPALASTPFLAGGALSVILASLLMRLLQSGSAREREIDERRRAVAALKRSNRAHHIVSQVERAIVYATDEETLLRQVCRIAVETAGYPIAVVERVERIERGAGKPASIAFTASEEPTVSLLRDDSEAGDRLLRRATESRAPVVARDLRAARGVTAAIAIPLLREGSVFAVLAMGAAEADAFIDAEVTLLGELGEVLAYGIANLRERAARMLAEATSRENERRFRAIFDQAALGIGIVDSTTGRFLDVNDQYCAITGYTASELFARTFGDITHADDLRRDLDNMRRLRTGELRAFHMEKRYVRKDDSIVWVALTCVPLWEGPGTDMKHVAMIEDITERKRAEEALREREQRLSSVYEAVGDVIFHVEVEPSDRFRFISVNPAFSRVTGLPEDAVVGKRVDEIIPEASLAMVVGNYRRAIEEKAIVRWEETTDYPTGRLSGEVTIAPVLDEEGRCTHLVGSVHDVTERKQASEQIRELHEALQRHAADLEHRVAERTAELALAKNAAESADRLKSAFLATMSHELRTPLNSIIGFTGILVQGLAGPLNAEQTKQLGMVQGSARHLLELINDVLDISKIEAGQLQVHVARFDLGEIIERVTALVKPLAEKKGLSVRVVRPPALDVMNSDRRRVEQILINLLNNAIKFTDKGCVTLTAAPAPSGNGHGAVCIRVADTGIGIKTEDLETLFQPFRQLDSGLERQHEGTGLGLAICRRLTELLGGSIRAESTLGQGTVFAVTLPLSHEG
jgi:PAS domain S-box-containing protein